MSSRAAVVRFLRLRLAMTMLAGAVLFPCWLHASAAHSPAALTGRSAPAPDSTVAEMRALRARALQERSIDDAATAVRLSRDVARGERLASILVLRHVLRQNGEIELGDSILLLACRAECSSFAADPAVLAGALEAELAGPTADRPVHRAVLGLFAQEMRDAITPSLHAELLLPLGAREADAAAVESMGDPVVAAEVWHAYGSVLLPRRRHPGAGSDARSAADAFRRALALRRAAGDRVGEAHTTSLLALAIVRGSASAASADSATALSEEAVRMAAGAPAEVRALLRRRGAAIAASRGDDAAAERRLEAAIALLPAGDALSAALHRYHVARELAAAGSRTSLRLARNAYLSLGGQEVQTETLARVVLTLAEAHRLHERSDSSSHHFRVAAELYLSVGDELTAARAYSAAAEDHLEHGRLAEAEGALESAGQALIDGPLEPSLATPSAAANATFARLLNDVGLLQLLRGERDGARERFRQAREVGGAGAEAMEAARNLAMLEIAETRPEDMHTAAWPLGLSWETIPALDVLEPPRASDRPLTTGLVNTYLAMRLVGRSELSEAQERLRQAIPQLTRAGHEESLRRAQGVLGLLYAQLGRADSAQHYIRLAGDVVQADALTTSLADATSTGGAALALRERVASSAPAEGVRMLQELLARARADADRLSEARALEVLGFWHLRRRPDPDPRIATAYYDSSAAVLRTVADEQYALGDWQHIQLAEQFTRLREEATLAWLARAPELGPETAALGAAAAADRGRNSAFEWLSGLRFGLWSRINDPFNSVSGHSLPEIGEELFEPLLSEFNDPPATLSYMLAADTLVTWLHVVEVDEVTRERRTRLHLARRPLAADSLVVLVGRVRASFGVEEGGVRGFGDLDPNPLTRGFDAAAGPPAAETLRAVAEVLLPAELRAHLPPGGELVIVPFGPLAVVPFAALPIDDAGTPLGERYRSRYLPSLAARRWGERHGISEYAVLSAAGAAASDSVRAARTTWRQRAVVIGDPTMPTPRDRKGDPVRLTQLPGAAAEARAVAGILGVPALTGAEATLTALRARVESATVLHLATHGFAYGTEELVGHSFVALAPGPADDGVLTVDELLGEELFRLPATELVVLSACQTGLGQLTAAEGTLGLQRAFLALGARSTLTSLWSVDDAATELLMRSFYRHWLDGRGKTEALRLAQAEVRGEPGSRFHHPRFWAAFQLVGDG